MPSPPLSGEQRDVLLKEMLKNRHILVENNKTREPGFLEKKEQTWKRIVEFAAIRFGRTVTKTQLTKLLSRAMSNARAAAARKSKYRNQTGGGVDFEEEEAIDSMDLLGQQQQDELLELYANTPAYAGIDGGEESVLGLARHSISIEEEVVVDADQLSEDESVEVVDVPQHPDLNEMRHNRRAEFRPTRVLQEAANSEEGRPSSSRVSHQATEAMIRRKQMELLEVETDAFRRMSSAMRDVSAMCQQTKKLAEEAGEASRANTRLANAMLMLLTGANSDPSPLGAPSARLGRIQDRLKDIAGANGTQYIPNTADGPVDPALENSTVGSSV